jgi:hypothetical protein
MGTMNPMIGILLYIPQQARSSSASYKNHVSLQGGNQLLAPLLTKEETDWDVI